MNRRGTLSLLLLLLPAGACRAAGPDHVAPELEAPEAWREGGAFASGPARAGEPEREWWRAFEDPVLDGLIERALARGPDLREALARLDEARALAGVARGERYPALAGELSYERRGESENTPIGQFVPDSSRYAVGAAASWELDLWGRVRRSVEAAEADLGASVADARWAAVTLAAETALAYVDLRAFQERLAIARANVALQAETLELVRARVDAGLVDRGDLAQAAANLESTRARVPELELGARVAENRIAVLAGVPPDALAAELAPAAPIPVPPLGIAVGVPADALRRRPDVRGAERRLAAETARIGVAEAELLPTLVLSGDLGLAAEEPGDLLESASNFFGIGPSLRWTLFDGGRLRRRVEAREARAEQALVRWERTVLRALEEAENAMAGLIRERARLRSLEAAAGHARDAVALARTQYREGLSDFQPVLDSERALAELEDGLAASEATIGARAIELHRALGG